MASPELTAAACTACDAVEADKSLRIDSFDDIIDLTSAKLTFDISDRPALFAEWKAMTGAQRFAIVSAVCLV